MVSSGQQSNEFFYVSLLGISFPILGGGILVNPGRDEMQCPEAIFATQQDAIGYSQYRDAVKSRLII